MNLIKPQPLKFTVELDSTDVVTLNLLLNTAHNAKSQGASPYSDTELRWNHNLKLISKIHDAAKQVALP